MQTDTISKPTQFFAPLVEFLDELDACAAEAKLITNGIVGHPNQFSLGLHGAAPQILTSHADVSSFVCHRVALVTASLHPA